MFFRILLCLNIVEVMRDWINKQLHKSRNSRDTVYSKSKQLWQMYDTELNLWKQFITEKNMKLGGQSASYLLYTYVQYCNWFHK